MNNLNSIIIEGLVNSNPIYIETSSQTGRELLRFVLKSIRKEKHGEEERIRILFIEVVAHGHLASTMESAITDGRQIRVVGWLSQREGFFAPSYVTAEHIELRRREARHDENE